jgi:hypothetical protein
LHILFSCARSEDETLPVMDPPHIVSILMRMLGPTHSITHKT